MTKVWILTTEYNDYDQHGAYFVAWWPKKPTYEQLGKYTDHLGRKNWEWQWYELEEVQAG
jgi:hypothetical protein